jgi:hypothetical protein
MFTCNYLKIKSHGRMSFRAPGAEAHVDREHEAGLLTIPIHLFEQRETRTELPQRLRDASEIPTSMPGSGVPTVLDSEEWQGDLPEEIGDGKSTPPASAYRQSGRTCPTSAVRYCSRETRCQVPSASSTQ